MQFSIFVSLKVFIAWIFEKEKRENRHMGHQVACSKICRWVVKHHQSLVSWYLFVEVFRLFLQYLHRDLYYLLVEEEILGFNCIIQKRLGLNVLMELFLNILVEHSLNQKSSKELMVELNWPVVMYIIIMQAITKHWYSVAIKDWSDY